MNRDLPVRAAVTILADQGQAEITAAWIPELDSRTEGSAVVRVKDETGQTLLHLFLSWEQLRRLRYQLSNVIEEALIRASEATPQELADLIERELPELPEDVSLDEAVQRG